ncbi:hypothetical protein B0J11DRAFT_618404 [Dendryphion nanum]|uniref:Ubiquitin-like protease family profile domain-containing protein n=1 Tax=Dendryphion nanum TaxID=256645 RepID=A0A9P9DBQ5_9PLEO|nr:hypothetical protein B0J11DRAFT_618404 [Dendryphion nanum]
MPKRTFSCAMDASSSSPPSPYALPFMPGQWDPVYDACDSEQTDTSPSPSLFATVCRLALTVSSITSLIGAAYRIVTRYTRAQRIQAVPVTRPDGARKKLLLDAGTLEQPNTPNNNNKTKRAVSRRALSGRRRQPVNPVPGAYDIWTSPSVWEVQTQSQLNDIAESGDLDIDVDADIKEEFKDCWTSTPPPGPRTTFLMGNANSNLPAAPVTPASNVFYANNYTTVVQSPNGTATRPGFWPVRNNVGTGSPVGASPGYNPAKIVGDYRRGTTSPSMGTVKHPRVQELANHNGIHAQRRSPRRDMHSPHSPNAYLSPPGIKNQAERISPNARSATKTPDRGIEGISVPSFDDDEEFGLFFTQSIQIPSPENKIAGPQTYDNDLSFLEDAPQPSSRNILRAGPGSTKKDVHISTFSNTKPFYHDRAVLDMVDEDSFFTFTKTNPYDEDVDATHLSIEVTESLEPTVEASPSPQYIPPLRVGPFISPLTEVEKEVINAAAQKAASAMPHSVDIVESKLSSYDFATLLPTQFNGRSIAWLNDNIVNEYLTLLVDHGKASVGYEHRRDGPAPPVHAFASQWYATMKEKPEMISRWATRKQFSGRKLLDVNLLLIPVCLGSHWRLVAIKPKERVIQYLDSLKNPPGDIVQLVFAWIKRELGEDYVKSEWTVQGIERDEQQSMCQLNGSDCGVFTCLNALALLRNESFNRVTPIDGMHEARERIAVSLMSGKQTGELD